MVCGIFSVDLELDWLLSPFPELMPMFFLF